MTATKWACKIRAPRGQAYCRLWVNADDSDTSFHFHLSAALESFFSTEPTVDSGLNEMAREAEHFFGCVASGELDSRFLVPLSSLPKRGLIATLSGIRMKSFGYEVSLGGGRLDLKGEELTRVRWDQREATDSSEEQVCVDVEGELFETEIDENTFRAVFAIVRSGLDHFVLEKTSGEIEHA